MKRALFFLLFLGCNRSTDFSADQLKVLQSQLIHAERALLKDQEEVDRLRAQLYEAELVAIEKRIDFFERTWQIQSIQHSNALFLKEREILHRIIQSGPFAARASDLLDRILHLITQVSDANN
jgi:galactokinase/mevalonate kinase-like predicted kinase